MRFKLELTNEERYATILGLAYAAVMLERDGEKTAHIDQLIRRLSLLEKPVPERCSYKYRPAYHAEQAQCQLPVGHDFNHESEGAEFTWT